MLILGRKVDQTIRIGHDIVIKVVRCRDGFVHIGIDAPDHVPVHREELYREIYGKEARDEPSS